MYTNEEKHTQLWKEKSKMLHILSWRHYGISKWGPSAGSKNRRAWSCWKNIRAQGNLHSGKTGSDKETKTKGRIAARQKLKKNVFLLSVLSSLIVSLKLSNQDLSLKCSQKNLSVLLEYCLYREVGLWFWPIM